MTSCAFLTLSVSCFCFLFSDAAERVWEQEKTPHRPRRAVSSGEECGREGLRSARRSRWQGSVLQVLAKVFDFMLPAMASRLSGLRHDQLLCAWLSLPKADLSL